VDGGSADGDLRCKGAFETAAMWPFIHRPFEEAGSADAIMRNNRFLNRDMQLIVKPSEVSIFL
jgi:hypothetical protein